MEEAGRRGKMLDWLWLVAWGVASSLWCLTASTQLGATFDEPTYLVHGLEYWRSGSHQGLMRLGTMPLPVDLSTLPLYAWERCTGMQLDPAADADLLLPWARAGTLCFWWLLLTYGWLAGWDLAGRCQRRDHARARPRRIETRFDIPNRSGRSTAGGIRYPDQTGQV